MKKNVMKTMWNWLVPMVCALSLAACGGGGGPNSASGAASGTTGGSGTAASIDVLASAATVGTGSTDTVTITATVKDASNVALAAAPVTFSTDTGTLSSAATATTTAGQATATLSAGSNKTNRAIVVTVKSGSITGTVSVAVVSAAAASVDVVGSSNRVGTGGSAITITAVVKTTNNVTLANAPIQFSADTGNLVSSATVTDVNGSAVATFSGGSDKSNRTATIKVVSGAVSGALSVVIDGTTLAVSGPSTLAIGAASDLSLKATDSTGSAVANLALTIAGSLNNIPAGSKVTTDSVGAAKYTYTATAAGSDVVTVAGAGVTVTSPIVVSGQNFAFTSPAVGATINVGASQAAAVRYLVNGAAPATGAYKVRFTSTAGTLTPTTAVDLTGGVASVQLQSAFAGPGTLQATVFDPAAPNVVVAQASVAVQFVATTPSSLVLQVSPSAIGPNAAGSTTQQAEVRATVLDAAFNPVAGVVVNFSRLSDPSGGNLLQPSATTDANGVAKVQYLAGATSTQTDGVTLQGAVATNAAVKGQAKLTVNQSALFIALGQGNEISNVNPTTYQKQWTAYVTDSTGAPVPNVSLTISALPTKYGKGTFAWNGKVWASSIYLPTLASPDGTQNRALRLISDGLNNLGGFHINCPSEDTLSATAANRNNGVLDPLEDVNYSGKLEPGNVISVNGGASTVTLKTDATGFAIINLQYAESYAYWVEIALKVSANVAGTESSNTAIFFAPGAAPDYNQETVAPAGQTSPFGVAATCQCSVDTRDSAGLCPTSP